MSEIDDHTARTCEANDELPESERDICAICGLGGADKIPHPCHWPGEFRPEAGQLVHGECERDECERAHAEFCRGKTESQIRDFVISNY